MSTFMAIGCDHKAVVLRNSLTFCKIGEPYNLCSTLLQPSDFGRKDN